MTQISITHLALHCEMMHKGCVRRYDGFEFRFIFMMIVSNLFFFVIIIVVEIDDFVYRVFFYPIDYLRHGQIKFLLLIYSITKSLF